jgi:hypothetical protein
MLRISEQIMLKQPSRLSCCHGPAMLDKRVAALCSQNTGNRIPYARGSECAASFYGAQRIIVDWI